MSKNPVAAARFFHFMVEVFLEEVLGWEKEERGVFGHPKGYYGTVEQQGRLTLHLHLVIWVHNAPPPQVIREKLTAKDSEFTKKLINYLESCHQGEFINGSLDEVRNRVGINPQAGEDSTDLPGPEYTSPTLTFPNAPPPQCATPECQGTCNACVDLARWTKDYESEIDDLIL
jgi:hypothetical protein